MPQIQLPMFPEGVEHITSELAVQKRDGQVTYFNGHMPIFMHGESDVRSFQMITAQFCVNGNVKQMDIVRAFGVTPISVKRAVARYRERGPKGFYAEPRRRGATVLTAPVLAEAQRLYHEGLERGEVAKALGIKSNTLGKAERAGRVHVSEKKKGAGDVEGRHASSKSERSIKDNEAAMGMGATDELSRVAASLGKLDAVEPIFETAMDVPNGGVLLAIPALLGVGLLRHARKFFQLPKGFYPLSSIFMLLAFMGLARLKSMERLRYCAPGEWGKLLGLDRVPEVRTLREKVALLSQDAKPQQYSAELCADWMGRDPDSASVLYIDGHVRVYHGRQTQLPRHYVARERLCLRATTDYWVNAMDGQPFFLLNQAVDPGLLQVLEHEIVPRLEREVPGQPTAQELDDDRLLSRFTLVFDREGYSPAFFLKMKQKRIACLTYHKYPKEDWPQEEFLARRVRLASGEEVELKLAERGVHLGGKLWMRECRKLTASGHQTSVLCSDYKLDLGPVAVTMFARWSQENFFKYMREHYGLDRLVDYATEPIPETTKVVNPAYRTLDGQVRRNVAVLAHKRAVFGAMTLETDIEPEKVEAFERDKAALHEQITALEKQVEDLKGKRKATAKHVAFAQLPEKQRFEQLRTHSKHLVDTVKMVAYRAESAMAQVLREAMSRHDDARSLLRNIYTTEVDLLPNQQANTLTVRLHHLANRSTDLAVRHLCAELNATETIFPGTNLRLVYELLS